MLPGNMSILDKKSIHSVHLIYGLTCFPGIQIVPPSHACPKSFENYRLKNEVMVMVSTILSTTPLGMTLSLLRRSNESGNGKSLERCQGSGALVESLIAKEVIGGKSAIFTVLGDKSPKTREDYHLVKNPVMSEKQFIVIQTRLEIAAHARKMLKLISLESGIVRKWVSLFAHSRIINASIYEGRERFGGFTGQALKSNIATIFVFLLISTSFSVFCFLIEMIVKEKWRVVVCHGGIV